MQLRRNFPDQFKPQPTSQYHTKCQPTVIHACRFHISTSKIALPKIKQIFAVLFMEHLSTANPSDKALFFVASDVAKRRMENTHFFAYLLVAIFPCNPNICPSRLKSFFYPEPLSISSKTAPKVAFSPCFPQKTPLTREKITI